MSKHDNKIGCTGIFVVLLLIGLVGKSCESCFISDSAENDSAETDPKQTHEARKFEEEYAKDLSISSDQDSTLLYHRNIYSKTSGKTASEIIASSFNETDVLWYDIYAIAMHMPDFDYLTMQVTYHWEYNSYEGAWREKSLPTLNRISLKRLRELHEKYKNPGGFITQYLNGVYPWYLKVLQDAGYDTYEMVRMKKWLDDNP